MSTLAEEAPDYAAKVTAKLARMNLRRVPWGMYVSGASGDFFTVTKSHREREARAELGETALALLDAMGVPVSVVDEIATALPWSATGAELVAKLQEIRGRG